MSRPPPSLLKRLKWRAEWVLQVGAEELIARLPGVWVFRLGESIGRLLWRTMRRRRRIVIKNLRIALAGEMPVGEIRGVARASFIRSVANLVSVAHTARVSPEVLESRVTVENPEVLEAAVKGGSGALLLPPHMGNWELLSRITRLVSSGRERGALYRPLNNPHLDKRLTERRRSEGARLFSKRDSLLDITGFLKDGGMIGVLADQRAGWQGGHTNFFGRLTRSSQLPQVLIRRCKVPALAISVRTTAPGRWALKYHPVAAPADTQACMDAIERAMRESLVDVFWFQDRWKCYIDSGSTPSDWLGDSGNRSVRSRHRALIWLPNAPAGWELPVEWRHPDVNFELALGEGQVLPAWAASESPVHRVGECREVPGIRKHLLGIDKAGALPLDFVASPRPDGPLRAACRREGQHFVLIKRP